MQIGLAKDGRAGLIPYPITDNRVSENGQSVTGVVVHAREQFVIPQSNYSQLDAVKHQYGCFFDTFLRNGKATVVAPAASGPRARDRRELQGASRQR